MPRSTIPRSTDPGLDAAIGRYCAAFGRDALPCLFFAARAGGEAVAAAMLDHAARAGRPLAYAAVAEALGAAPAMGGAL